MAPFRLLRQAGLPATAPDAAPWVASWGAAQMPLAAGHGLPDAILQDGTLRQTVRLSLGGSRVRVRISMCTVPRPSWWPAPPLAARRGPVRCSGCSSAAARRCRFRLAARHTATRSTCAWRMAPTWPSRWRCAAQAGARPGIQARATSFIAPGDQAAAARLQGAASIARRHQLADVEVSAAAPACALVAIGDSITGGYGVAPDTNGRCTDYLARRLDAAGMRSLGVVNAGIGGGALLRSRFARDVLVLSGISHVIGLAGANDLGGLHRSGADTPAALQTLLGEFQQAHRDMLALARGICVIGATLTPFMGSGYYQPSAANEALRQALNAWIRTPGVFDCVADFDAALADPARPSFLRPLHDSGDGLHPSQAGYAALADAVPLARLRKCSYSKMQALQ